MNEIALVHLHTRAVFIGFQTKAIVVKIVPAFQTNAAFFR